MVVKPEILKIEEKPNRSNFIVNTSDLNSEELSTYIALSEEIDRRRVQRRSRSLTPCIKIIKTHEETFEGCNSFDGDMFLTALEHQNSYVPQVTDLDESLENAMKYFDDDVNIKSTAESSPCKEKVLSPGSRVAVVVDKFKMKTMESLTSPNEKEQKYRPEIRANIQELRKRYESCDEPVVVVSSTPKTPKEKSPKTSRKSRVKQMAQLFNSKISQIMRKDVEYEKLQNEFSPEPKPVIERIVSKPTPPIPKVRTKMPTFRAGLPSPRTRRKQNNKVTTSTTCLVAEDCFRQLSVKDKALLYNKFIEDMSKKNPKFSKHAQAIEEKVKKQFARGEVVTEKQASVKELKKELEAKCNFPKQTVSPLALERINALPLKKPLNKSASLTTPTKAKEAEDISTANISPELDDDIEESELHISTLTVVLKPSPNSSKRLSKSVPRCRKDLRYQTSLGNLEPCSKRSNIAMHSSLPIEAYAPPKKIRRTRAERMAPKMFFQNQHLERLFYSWLKDRNGVTFNIAPITNTEETIDIAIDQELEHDTLEETHKSAVDRLLEEAIAKLENVEQQNSLNKEANFMEEKEIDTADVPKALPTSPEIKEDLENRDNMENETVPLTITTPTTSFRVPRKSRKAPAPPVPAPRPSLEGKSATSSVLSSTKHSEAEESESGLSSIPKITTDDSQPEHREKERETSEQSQENEMPKPFKPPLKKKTRRNLTWKKDNSIIETHPTTTTDSDSDYKSLEAAKKITTSPTKNNNKNKASNYVKRLLFKAKPNPNPSAKAVHKKHLSKKETSFVGLDKTLIKNVNSPRKIRSAYTLTVVSSPSPQTENEYYRDLDVSKKNSLRETSCSCPSLYQILESSLKDSHFIECCLPSKAVSSELSPKPKQNRNRLTEQKQLIDSFIDQGFETGSNEIESPVRKTQSRRNSLNEKQDSVKNSRRLSNDFQEGGLSESNPSGFSTPVKGHIQQSFTSSSGLNQHQFSPIATPLKSARRRSFYENESRRNSLTMQVIKEDHPLDTPTTGFSTTENGFFANAPTLDMESNITDFNTTKDSSTLWITAGDFTITTDIYYNSRERIRCLYNIFSQKSFETKVIHFGIDNNKFSYQKMAENDEDISKRLPKTRDTSHYWFQTSELVIPFSGKFIPEHKVNRLFKFISEALSDNDQIRIGVDAFEFCVFELNDDNIPEFVSNQPKFSIESSYSMLIGLQSGPSNGLEGRSKFAWPSCMSSSTHSNNIRTSDLGNSGCESEEFDADMGRFSFSTFGIDDLNMRRTSESGMSADCFSLDYENEPLDQLFKTTSSSHKETTKIDSDATSALSDHKMEELLGRTQASVSNALKHLKEIIPEVQNKYEYVKNSKKNQMKSSPMSLDDMLETLQNQQTKLKIVLDTLRNYAKTSKGANKFMEQIHNSPDYEIKLQQIVQSIEEIGRDNGFKHCSKEQLESFMYFLSHYADLILSPFSEHMNTILDTLLDRRSVEV